MAVEFNLQQSNIFFTSVGFTDHRYVGQKVKEKSNETIEVNVLITKT